MAKKPVADYQTLTAELEQLLAAMQHDSVDVDTALAKYQRGKALLAELAAYLDTAEMTIRQHAVNTNGSE